ncbi:MAG TPA: hypothetical protein VGR02_20565 [Thermoanaerobaculia bacterium]|jgi:hypothetical protein|nr:hypothetical protein [Thermoanaerobaculia bacterium]
MSERRAAGSEQESRLWRKVRVVLLLAARCFLLAPLLAPRAALA